MASGGTINRKPINRHPNIERKISKDKKNIEVTKYLNRKTSMGEGIKIAEYRIENIESQNVEYA